MSTIALSDDQLAVIDRAAAALQAPDRGPFIEAVYDRLTGQPIGPGSLHRALADCQREFLQARPIVPDGMSGHAPKYGRARHFIGRTR